MSLESVERWYSRIPAIERDQPLVLLDGFAYTPNQVLSEVRRNTPTGARLQQVIERRTFTEAIDKYGLAILRLKERLAKTPPDFKIFVGPRSFTPQELLKEIEAGTKIGRSFIEAEVTRVEEVLKGA
jgi:hypothetical protein